MLASLALTLCACQKAEKIVRSYGEPGKIPTYMARLFPDTEGDTKYAFLLRRYDQIDSAIATADGFDGEFTTVYSLPNGVITYELTAKEGLIAFYEVTTYNDGSVNYALKVIDTNNGNKVHSPYKKTVADDNDIQTRFIVIYDNSVYYLTKSNLLGRCRVMKYSVPDKELTEYLSFDFTDDEKTAGNSCTFISENSGYLSCGTVEGNRTTLKTYDLKTGKLEREQPLPYNAEFVYMADHDYRSGMYVIYYMSAQGDERIATVPYSGSDVLDLMKLGKSEYVSREEVRIEPDGIHVYFELQNMDETDPHNQFTGVRINSVAVEKEKYGGCILMIGQDEEAFGLCFDEEQGYEKMILKKLR